MAKLDDEDLETIVGAIVAPPPPLSNTKAPKVRRGSSDNASLS